MTYRILEKERIADRTFRFKIWAPEIARKARAGQFVVVRIDEKGERIPLTLADWDGKTITLMVLAIGATTEQLAEMQEEQVLADVVGPLGEASEISNFVILGARSNQHLFWTERFEEISDKLVVCTDDGSYGKKGFVTDALKELILEEKELGGGIDRVVVIGPPIVMKLIADITKPLGVKTVASINSIMIDGMGMCGGCRVSVGGKTKFACVDGPEFDAHSVDWDDMIKRNKAYLSEEKVALKEAHECKLKNLKEE